EPFGIDTLRLELVRRSHDLFRRDRRLIELDLEWCERIRDRVRDRRRRRDGATLAYAFDAKRIERRRGLQMDECHVWNVAAGRKQVIHEGPREELSLRIVGEALEQDAAQTLRRAADNLALQ